MPNSEEQILNRIKEAKNILITFEESYNGDSIASSLALFLILKKLNKNTQIITNQLDDYHLKKFQFLPKFNAISNKLKTSDKFIISLNIKNTKVENIKYELKDNKLNFIINPQNGSFSKQDISSKQDINYDLIITLNAPDLNSLGEIYTDNSDFFHTTPIVNIDHNSKNKNFGEINLVDAQKSSVCEILFYFFYKNYQDLIDEDIATCLLCGIISKTRNFKTLDILPNTLVSAAKLIALKAKREEIVNHLYFSRDINTMKIFGNILTNLKSELDNRLIWFELDNKNIDNIQNIILEAINELIINIPQTEIIIAFYKVPSWYKNIDNNSSYILVHSNGNINALDLTSEFNPKGNKTSAFIKTIKPLEEMKKIILDKIINKLKQINLT